MRRELHVEVTPADDNTRNRLRVRVSDLKRDDGTIAGVGFEVVATSPRGDHWVTVHPAEIDELVRMLMDAKLVARQRLEELGLRKR